MRTIDARTTQHDALATEVAGRFQDMIGGLRCAGSGRLVKLGISMTHLHVLWMIQHHGEMAMSRLAEVLDVSLSSATGIVDRMEDRGLVERTRVADDRRVVHVRITPGGSDSLDEIESVKRDQILAVLRHLDPDELGRLARSADDLHAAFIAELGPTLSADHQNPHVSATEERD